MTAPRPHPHDDVERLDVVAEADRREVLGDPGALALVLEQCLAAAQLEGAPHGQAARSPADAARDRRAADVVDLVAASLEVLGRDRLDAAVATSVLQTLVVALRQCARWCELAPGSDESVVACGRACRTAEQAVLDALVGASAAR